MLKKMNITKILADHLLFLNNAGGRRANLSGVDLSGVDLSGANLYRANLSGVDLSDGWECDGNFHHITNIGSENGTLELYSCSDSGWYIKRGCFSGSKDTFLAAVSKTHGNTVYGAKYVSIINLFCENKNEH